MLPATFCLVSVKELRSSKPAGPLVAVAYRQVVARERLVMVNVLLEGRFLP